jgi:hypothetical protein
MDDERFIALEAHYNAILPTLATKADIDSLRAEVLKLVVETQRWIVATIIGLFLGFAGLFIAMGNIMRPSAPPAPVASVAPAQQPAATTVYNVSPDRTEKTPRQ